MLVAYRLTQNPTNVIPDGSLWGMGDSGEWQAQKGEKRKGAA